jgi:fatty-acyl-CoA synthase
MMLGTMQDYPLTIGMLFRHGAAVHGDSEVVTFEGDGSRRASYREVAARTERLAAALQRLGIEPGDRVGTFAWNIQEHLEAYFAVPGIGAVLHTLNIRLFPEQLEYVVNHAADRIVLVDGSLIPLLIKVAPQLTSVEKYVVIGEGDTGTLEEAAPNVEILDYGALLDAEQPGIAWPDVDERAAAAMCYTSGTTGNPKGVVYTHRSTFLHSFAAAYALGISDRDRVLPIVPMFHANAWGLPYAGWTCGSDFLMPNRFLQAEPLARFVNAEKPTFSGAVPTIWADVLRYSNANPGALDLTSLETIVCGGSAVPRTLMEAFETKHGVRMIQGWGMTETSPLAAVGYPPKDVELGSPDELDWRARTGRVMPGVELRIVADDGTPLANDGEEVGEIEVRGPWITGSYYGDPAPEKFDDGWLRTGDVGTLDERGYIQITDRAKDVIKSGGEWISSVELENHLMAHPRIVEAAVIGVPDPRWDERPLACVVVEGDEVTIDELRAFLGDRVARWQVPERWSFIDEVPKTSVGKFDKKVLRARHEAGELPVEQAVEQGGEHAG